VAEGLAAMQQNWSEVISEAQRRNAIAQTAAAQQRAAEAAKAAADVQHAGSHRCLCFRLCWRRLPVTNDSTADNLHAARPYDDLQLAARMLKKRGGSSAAVTVAI